MALKILIIGATGHIGGAVLDVIHRQYSANIDIEILVQVRNESDAAAIVNPYNVTPLLGSLDEIEPLLEHITSADIVINCAPDVPFATAITRILSTLQSTSKQKYYIGTSGAASIWDAPNGDEPDARIWDDITDIDSILSRPDTNTHSLTDRVVLNANSESLHTAIISPVLVVGVSPSLTHPVPLTLPHYIHVVKTLGGGFTIGKGLNKIGFVNVKDLARLYSFLVSSAVDALRSTGDIASKPDQKIADVNKNVMMWGKTAYYYGCSYELGWKEFMSEYLIPALREHKAPFVTAENGEELQSLSIEDATEIVMKRLGGFEGADVWSKHIAESMGTSMRVKSSRAEKVFAWKSEEGVGIDESVQTFVQKE